MPDSELDEFFSLIGTNTPKFCKCEACDDLYTIGEDPKLPIKVCDPNTCPKMCPYCICDDNYIMCESDLDMCGYPNCDHVNLLKLLSPETKKRLKLPKGE